MANQDVDTLARKIVSLERRHAALARAQQLPSSSVRLAEGEDVMLPSAIQNGEDAYSETGIIGERTDSMGDLLDSEVEYGTWIPEWIEGSAHTGDNAWDGTQLAIDKATEVESIVEELTNIPKAPTGLTELSNVGAFTSVGARAEVGVSWTEVVTSVKDEPIGVDLYRVYVDGALRVEETQPPTSISIPSGVSAEIRVSAVAEGLESDLSEALSITGALPSVANLIPTNPVLSTSHGNVRSVWDGLYTTPTLPGAHTIRVEARVGSGAWVQQGSALSGAGEQLVSVGEVGDTVEVRFLAYDQLQRLTGTSATASIEVQGVGLTDLDEAVNDYLSDIEAMAIEAQQSASGDGNKIHYGNTAPVGTEHKVGDTWFDGANGNKIHTWDGENWSAAQFGTDAISDTAINAAKLAANAVTEGKILNGAISNDKLSTAVKDSITTAQSTADNAATVAANATTAASAAQGVATAAQEDADQAIADALAAANVASGAATAASAAQSTADTARTEATNKAADAEAAAKAHADAQAEAARLAAIATASGDATAKANAAKAAAEATAAADALAKANAAQAAAEAKAATAQSAAEAAQTTANTKGKVIIQSAAPAAADRLVQNLWIDTTGGANTPKRWVSGTTWAVVTDKAATDAAAAAATAQSAANAAQSRADDAHTIASGAATAASAAASAASAAQTAANNAQTTANGKNKIVRSTADASSPANYVAGDQWWKYSGTQITAMWIHSGSAWVSQTLTDSVITNLNAGSITAGTISSARLSATNIKAVLINAGAIETANIAAGAITAASGIIADAAIGTAKIIDGSITTAKIKELAVTNAEIANGTIQNAKIANLDAAKITTGELAAARVKMDAAFVNKMVANKVLVSGENLIKNTDFVGEAWTRTNGATSVVFAPIDGPDGRPAVASAATTTVTYAAYYAGRTRNPQWAIPAREGEQFRASAWVYSPTAIAASTVGIGAIRYTEDGTRSASVQYRNPEIPANTWVRISQDLTLLETTRSFGIYAAVAAAHTDAVYFSDFSVVRKTSGELIVDGSIKAHLMDANEIYSDEAHMNVLSSGLAQFDEITGLGNKLTISANESVEFIVGRQNTMDEQLGVMQSTLDDTADAAGQALSEADAARTAALAAGADLVAQSSEIALIKQNVADHQAVFRLSDTGAQIAFSDNSASLDMTPQSITFVSNDTEVAAITNESIIIYRGVFETAQVGNHLMQKRGSTRTIFTPIEGS